MRAYSTVFITLVLVALALLAGTAGYITHQALHGPPQNDVGGNAAGVAAAPVLDSVAAARGEDPMTWPLATPTGGQRRLDEWPAPVVVVNFWATWCPPCLREIPAFMALQSRYGERGVQFLGVALDQADAVAPFVAERELNYPVVLGDDQVIRMMQHFGNTIGGLPYTVVLRNGAVAYTHQGEWEAAAAEAQLLEFLEGG